MRDLYTENRQSFGFLLLFISILILSGCGTGGGYNNTQPWPQQQAAPAAENPSDITEADTPAQEDVTDASAVKVALLLPLSGTQANLGESMQRAAEMALFDIGHSNFELMPRDTKGTPEGAAAAARAAIQDGAKLVIGPVFSNEVKAVQTITQAAGINMVAFSTDWTLANKNTFLIGFLPFDQVERVVRYATASGYKRIGVLSPSDTYGNAVVNAFNEVARPAGVSITRTERLPLIGTHFPEKIRAFSNYDRRQVPGDAQGAPYDAVLMPLGGGTAKQVGALMSQFDLPPQSVKRLGTGLMDDPALASETSLQGAWFAAPSPDARRKFEQRYGATYGVKPMRLASLAYDATALAAVLARNTDGPAAFDHSAITNPNGFSGVDGIFRFRADGISERGLSVLEYRDGRIVEIDSAPNTFQREAF